MTPQQEAAFNAESKIALKRLDGMQNGGTIPCEYSACSCTVRRQLGVRSFSTIVTPSYKVEFVCADAARDFAIKNGSGHLL